MAKKKSVKRKKSVKKAAKPVKKTEKKVSKSTKFDINNFLPIQEKTFWYALVAAGVPAPSATPRSIPVTRVVAASVSMPVYPRPMRIACTSCCPRLAPGGAMSSRDRLTSGGGFCTVAGTAQV